MAICYGQSHEVGLTWNVQGSTKEPLEDAGWLQKRSNYIGTSHVMWSMSWSTCMDHPMDHHGPRNDPRRWTGIGTIWERYIRTLIHVLSIVLCDQSSYQNIGYISSSTRVHLTNNSAYEHSWPCSILWPLPTLPSDILRSLAGAIYQAVYYRVNTVLTIGLWTIYDC